MIAPERRRPRVERAWRGHWGGKQERIAVGRARARDGGPGRHSEEGGQRHPVRGAATRMHQRPVPHLPASGFLSIDEVDVFMEEILMPSVMMSERARTREGGIERESEGGRERAKGRARDVCI